MIKEHINYFELSVLIQIVYNIFIAVSFAFHLKNNDSLQIFLITRIDQFCDLIFGAIIIGGLHLYTKNQDQKETISRLQLLLQNAVYCRLIFLSLLGLLLDHFSPQFSSIFLTFAQFIFTQIAMMFVPQQHKLTLVCNTILIICIYQFTYRLDHSHCSAILYVISFITWPVSIAILSQRTLKISQISSTISTLNKMGNMLVNAFTNALPSKILPKIMKAESLPCEIVNDVNFCYMYIKPPINQQSQEEQLNYLSKVNHFYCLLDFFADGLDIQKIKSSYSYYMCCTGAQQYLNSNNTIKEKDYPNHFDSSKILFTFCLISQEIANALGLKCCSGITKGDIVMGAVSVTTSVINFDTYGDVINTAARIARNNENGVFVHASSFTKNTNYDDDMDHSFSDGDSENVKLEKLLYHKINYDKVKLMFLKAAPQYNYGNRNCRAYKGKGEISIQQLLPSRSLKQYACQAFQMAYINLVADCLQQYQDEQNEIDLKEMEREIESSLIESSESFIDSDALSSEFNQSNQSFSVQQQIPLPEDDEMSSISHNSNQVLVQYQQQSISTKAEKQLMTSTQKTLRHENSNLDKSLGSDKFDIGVRTQDIQNVDMLNKNSNLTLLSIKRSMPIIKPISKQTSFSKSNDTTDLQNFKVVAGGNTMKVTDEVQSDKSEDLENFDFNKFTHQINAQKQTFEFTTKPQQRSIIIKQASTINVQDSTSTHKQMSSIKSKYSKIADSSYQSDISKNSNDTAPTYNEQQLTNHKDMLLKPQLHHFLEQAKRSNELRDNSNSSTKASFQGGYSQQEEEKLKLKLQNIDEDDEAHKDNTLSLNFKILKNDSHGTESINTDMSDGGVQNFSKMDFDPLLKPNLTQQNSISEPQKIGIDDFGKSMIQKLDLLEMWLNNVSNVLPCMNIVYYLLSWFNGYWFIKNIDFKVSIMNITMTMYDLHWNTSLIQVILALGFHSYQLHYINQLKREYLIQKKQYEPKRLEKMFYGQFFKFNQIYNIIINLMQYIKIYSCCKILSEYKDIHLFIWETRHLIVLIASDLVLLEIMQYQAGCFLTNIIPVVSFQYKAQVIMHIVGALIISYYIPFISVVLQMSSFIHIIFMYPRLKTFYVNSKMGCQMQEQITQGKNLLKNILPQITIDSLLLTTLEQQTNQQSNISQQEDMVILNKQYQVFKLKSIEQLHNEQQLRQLAISVDDLNNLNNIVNNSNQKLSLQDYYRLRFNQLIYKYSKLPNPRSFGACRPVINFGQVAYLNLDVCQFTSFCSKHTVQEMLDFLVALFNKFDERIRLTRNLIQVKISGDSYELMSLPTILKQYQSKINLEEEKLQNLKYYEAVIQLVYIGLGFIQDCKQVLKTYPEWQDTVGLRVGISFGEVTGSLLGNKICRFDTFGNIPIEAEEAQSNANRNTIMLNRKAWDVINNNSNILKDYIIDFVTTETLKNNYVNYNDEVVDFELLENDYGIGIKGIRGK